MEHFYVIQYGILSLKTACFTYLRFTHFPHIFLTQTFFGFKMKHFVCTMLKKSLPTKFASLVSTIFKQALKLKEKILVKCTDRELPSMAHQRKQSKTLDTTKCCALLNYNFSIEQIELIIK